MTPSVPKSDTDDSDDDDMHDSNPSLSIEEDTGFYSRYETKDVLGHGIASTVRKCIEKGTGKVFAVKMVDISTEHQTHEQAQRLREETLNEVALLKKLSSHLAIINLHDFYDTSSLLFAVFEMAPKGELFDQLTIAVTFSEKRTKRIMRQLFDGVTYLHSFNIVHRDLKLENILCIDDERIVISDFGFAVQLKPNERLRDLCGTPGYLSPEALRSQMYDDASGYGKEVDNWALGVIMYTLLAGYAPFYHRRQLLMLRMIQEAKYEFRAEQWYTISDDAKNLIKGLLVIDVKHRMTAAECLQHAWFGPVVPASTITDQKFAPILRFRRAIGMVQFLLRLQNIKDLKRHVDRIALGKRPFRDRTIRHESEACEFQVYGHWVNRGFYYSRDMLFANNPRPKRQHLA